MSCDFLENYYVRDSYIPVLQSLSVLNEDATDVTFENPIYHRVRDDIGQHLEICRFKDDQVFVSSISAESRKKRTR